MKKTLFKRLATIGCLAVVLAAVFSFGESVKTSAADAVELTADQKVSALFDTYYADGVYTKDTKIFMTDDAVLECIDYFHAKSTLLERTTYYAGDALWMSRGNGTYSYYGTKYNGEGEAVGVTNASATTPMVAPENAPVVLSGTGKESMENYYVTLFDFKESTYNATWTESNGVYTTNDPAVVDNFRQFTAPCILPTEGAANYLQFTKASVEEVGTTLVMNLYVDGTDAEGKLTTTDGLFSQATLTNDNKYVVAPGKVLASMYYYSEDPTTGIYNTVSQSATGWIDVEGVARYGMGHGTSTNYTMFKKGETGAYQSQTQCNIWAQYQYLPYNSSQDSMLTIIEATESCYGKFIVPDNFSIYGWIKVYIRKYDASTDTWSVLKYTDSVDNTAGAKPYFACDYQQLDEGDKLVLEVTNRGNNIRNIRYGAGIEIAEFGLLKPNDLSDVKSLLLDTNNAVAMTETVRSLSKGNVDPYMSIGLLEGTKELPVIPGGANGWCGFTSSGDTDFMRVQFLADTKPDAFYYTYTAKRSGYVYIDQLIFTWNGDVDSNVVATVNGEEVYNSGVRTHVQDGQVYDKFAVYLETGETLKVQVNHLSNPARSVFQIRNLNLAFIPSATEYALPEGYATLIDYLNA